MTIVKKGLGLSGATAFCVRTDRSLHQKYNWKAINKILHLADNYLQKDIRPSDLDDL